MNRFVFKDAIFDKSQNLYNAVLCKTKVYFTLCVLGMLKHYNFLVSDKFPDLVQVYNFQIDR